MDILERIAVALEKNNELLEGAAEGRERVLAAANAATNKPVTTKKADKPAETVEKPAETATEGPSLDDLKASVVGYTEGTEGAERDARKAKIAEVFGKVNATNVGTVPKEKYKAVINTLNKLKAAGNVLADEAASDEDDDLLGD